MNKKTLTLVICCIGIFLCMLDTTVMNIALPAIQNGLHSNLDDLSWAINAYVIVFAALTIPLSRIAERVGMHKFFLLGLLMFLIGSVLSATASELSFLIVGRVVQSLGAATIFPLSMVIGISTVDSSKRTRVIAALGVTQGLAAALGPTIGGLLTQFSSWRWIFLINIPFILISLVLSMMNLNFHEKRSRVKIDSVGAILSIIALFTLTLALVQGQSWGWRSILIISLFSISLLSIITFIIYERHAEAPMIPMILFKDQQFNGAALTIVLSNLFLVAVTVVLPTYFTKIQGKNEFIAALLVTPISAMIFVFSPIAAVLIQKLGARIVIATGFLSMTISYILFSTINMDNIIQVVGTCLLLGFGYGIIAGPIVVLAASDFTGEVLTASQSVAGVLRQVGVVLAVAIFVTGLYSNVNSAKLQSIKYAEQKIEKLSIPNEQKKEMTNQVTEQIQEEKNTATFSQNHISANQKKELILQHYNQMLANNSNLPQVKKEKILQEVTIEVNKKIQKINSDINDTILGIVARTKGKFSDAFVSLYRLSIFFVGVSMGVSFLFKRKSKLERIM
ncbi:DHA2 family efflux MFS transporter permease subunit [Lactococcus hircilactis]|uniref:DHA2 family efflux MFS transporter permease subunit n=1 Tax=Lactococcus hircilactis TaxID=1494462 RepID=A0A7X2D0J1_9LACT|nr:MFS transporter [Lactococcus hircilactis]MQW39954.1 DHA2 family efflux MFS transporter permease subunit [Lactococcus hircilactis]